MVHFEDNGMFPELHWRILEDSGRFLASIPRGLALKFDNVEGTTLVMLAKLLLSVWLLSLNQDAFKLKKQKQKSVPFYYFLKINLDTEQLLKKNPSCTNYSQTKSKNVPCVQASYSSHISVHVCPWSKMQDVYYYYMYVTIWLQLSSVCQESSVPTCIHTACTGHVHTMEKKSMSEGALLRGRAPSLGAFSLHALHFNVGDPKKTFLYCAKSGRKHVLSRCRLCVQRDLTCVRHSNISIVQSLGSPTNDAQNFLGKIMVLTHNRWVCIQ